MINQPSAMLTNSSTIVDLLQALRISQPIEHIPVLATMCAPGGALQRTEWCNISTPEPDKSIQFILLNEAYKTHDVEWLSLQPTP